MYTGADAVANDGVYSRYFTGFDKDGTYTATFHVVGNNDTKTLKQDNTTYGKVPNFQRTKVAGFFEVVNYSNVTNNTKVQSLYPPPKIVDLKVLAVERLSGQITLQWSAVGNVLDHGKGQCNIINNKIF